MHKRVYSSRPIPSKSLRRVRGSLGFTLIELLTALIILSLLALMSHRGLGAVLDAREYARQETEKWRRVVLFLSRFERDVGLAAPRPVRAGSGVMPAWQGRLELAGDGRTLSYLEFSRFATAEGMDVARRVAYRLNPEREIELWLWPGLDIAPGVQPVRYTLLTGVTRLELQYLDATRAWVATWPSASADSSASGVSSIPEAVRLKIVLVTGEEIERIF